MRLSFSFKAFVFWYGAIAQLGERVLCKHEVVGSIPSGSTRWFGRRRRSIVVISIAVNAERQNIVRETSLRMSHPTGCACVISDIVKRRSIRVLDLQSNLRNPIHNLQVISALAHRKMTRLLLVFLV